MINILIKITCFKATHVTGNRLRISAVLAILLLSQNNIKAQTNQPSTTQSKTGGATAPVYLPAAYSAGVPNNYISSWQPRIPLSDTTSVISSTDVTRVGKSTQYIDGLGRVIQSVNWKASPAQKDLVAPTIYDAFGREQYRFMPYASPGADGSFKLNPFGEQSTFYSTTYPAQQGAYSGESVYYGKVNYEASPLNRVVKTFAPGNNWAGSEGSAAEHATQQQYLVSTASDSVQTWNITNNGLTYVNNDVSTNIPVTAGAYGAGQLYKNVTIDEQGNNVVEYKDKDGRVVLKKVQVATSPGTAHVGWLCTYYVYDLLGNLRFVIPPKAVAALQGNATWDLTIGTGSLINELCFRYEYDGRNRMMAKKVPGAGWVYMIYDQRDRLVFTQDANMRTTYQWLYILYDGLNRSVQTGMMADNITPAGLQAYVNANTGNNSFTTVTTNGTYVPSVPSDMLMGVREVGRSSYQASNSIGFTDGFASENGAEFIASILPSSNGSFSNTVTVLDNPLPAGTNPTALTYTYYDDYSSTAKAYSTANNSKLGIGGNVYGDTLPPSASIATRSLVTVTRVRVIENPSNLALGGWMESAIFYDDKGRVIQTNADNYRGGQEVTTNRYDFGNKVICSYLAHNNPTGSDTERVMTNYDYDHAGRLLTVTKLLNDSAATRRLVARNNYDALGQLLRKELGQKSSTDTTALNNQDYSYNIRGWLKGMNWNYGAASGPTTSQMNIASNKWFAMDLSYDWGYAASQFNGNIAGQRWQSAGDGAERSYGYGYDGANRLLYGDFNQRFGTSWAKADPGNTNFTIDFSVKMGDGINASSAYDANGNILAMQQQGLKLNASSLIDNLGYGYNTNSNKLAQVSDAANDPGTILGDFHYSGTKQATDYNYDNNGNLILDNNKSISTITYNHLNLPYLINVTGKGTITYIYDAAGNKLQKRTYDSVKNTLTMTTDYLGGFVYENSVLQFLGHEEGRVRLNHNVSVSSPSVFVYDYFVKDHLGNTRMVLTDEQQQDVYPVATLEDGAVGTESNYYTINTGAIVPNPASFPPASTYPNNNGNPPYNTNPTSNTTATSLKMYKLNGATGDKLGLGITLKVMAGDNVAIYGKSYWQGGVPTNTGYNIVVNNLLTALAGTSGVVSAGKGATAAALTGSGVTPSDVTSWLTNEPNTGVRPKAYINWILFDEQFRLVSGSSGFSMVSDANVVYTHPPQSVGIVKNGYLYVYCSNESNVDVFFDNLQVIQTRGPLLSEDHYYPFGLTMSGISSKAAGKLENRYKYNGKELQSKEFSDGSGLELYDYGKRMGDPQLGRWWVLDPKADLLEMSTPYAFCYNNPISYTDPDGELAIFINGRAFGDSRPSNYLQNQSNPYFPLAVLDAVKNSGIPHSDNMMFVDGDRYYNHVLRHDIERLPGDEEGVQEGGLIDGNYASERKEAGAVIGKADFQYILSKLARDPKTHKIIEKIEIYTHSRGAAFGAGYVDALLELIKQNADQFADPNNEIDLVYNMAPNETGGDATEQADGLNSYSQHHDYDPLSGSDMKGTKANFTSAEGGSFLGHHYMTSFVKDITAFTKAFANSNGNSKKLIDDFVKRMKNDYGITVTVQQ